MFVSKVSIHPPIEAGHPSVLGHAPLSAFQYPAHDHAPSLEEWLHDVREHFGELYPSTYWPWIMQSQPALSDPRATMTRSLLPPSTLLEASDSIAQIQDGDDPPAISNHLLLLATFVHESLSALQSPSCMMFPFEQGQQHAPLVTP